VFRSTPNYKVVGLRNGNCKIGWPLVSLIKTQLNYLFGVHCIVITFTKFDWCWIKWWWI